MGSGLIALTGLFTSPPAFYNLRDGKSHYEQTQNHWNPIRLSRKQSEYPVCEYHDAAYQAQPLQWLTHNSFSMAFMRKQDHAHAPRKHKPATACTSPIRTIVQSKSGHLAARPFRNPVQPDLFAEGTLYHQCFILSKASKEADEMKHHSCLQ